MTSAGLADHLLGVIRQRDSGYRATRLYPAGAAILNLIFCAYVEQYLKHDDSGYHLSLFLFIESLVLACVSTTNFFTTTREVLSKTRIFPVTSAVRMHVILATNFRRPVMLVLVGSNAFFIIVLFRHLFPHNLVAALLLVFMTAVIDIALTTTLMILHRRSVPTTGAITLLTFLLFVFFIGEVVFHVESLLLGIPFLGWATRGILAAKAGNLPTALLNLGCLALAALAGLIVGRKLA